MDRSIDFSVSSGNRFLFPDLLLLVALVGCQSAEQPATGAGPAAVGKSQAESQQEATAQPGAAEEKPRPVYLAKVGFNKPKSVLHDPQADVYLVSNMNGRALDDDGNGFISRVDPEGKLLKLKWIDGEDPGVKLSAPKGMAISGDSLYVADVDGIRVFDRQSGKPKRSIKVRGATFLSDLAAGPRGEVYVSDTGFEPWAAGFRPSGTDAVYRIEGAKAVPLIKSSRLGFPTGLQVDQGGVWVVTRSGELFLAPAAGGKQMSQKLPRATLDGIVKTNDGELLISSWDGKCIFRRKKDGSFDQIGDRVSSPADIGYDSKRNRVLIPLLTKHMLVIHPL
jgi:sugar lactone lactonase YvrE